VRFRKLDFEELTSLEKEFKEFLIINHIHDEEWRNLNKETPEKVSALVEVFSDTVLLKVYGKISYLEFYGEDIWSFFKIDNEWINSIHIQVNNSRYDLPKQIDEILTYPEKFKVHKGKKKLVNFKEDEVHQLVLKGCIVGIEDSWNAIENLLK
jgi:hypothetical protein